MRKEKSENKPMSLFQTRQMDGPQQHDAVDYLKQTQINCRCANAISRCTALPKKIPGLRDGQCDEAVTVTAPLVCGFVHSAFPSAVAIQWMIPSVADVSPEYLNRAANVQTQHA